MVRWWAKRADLILLLFDPDKPGTTGETLDVLTKALSGLKLGSSGAVCALALARGK